MHDDAAPAAIAASSLAGKREVDRGEAGKRIAEPSPRRMADAIRVLTMDAVQQADSGHPGMPMGMADVAVELFTRAVKFDAADPHWPDRDRFVLSVGHGSMLLYAVLHLTGSPHVSLADIRDFRQWGSATPGHPEYGHTPGVETTTGPLGQGLGAAVGMAMAERHLAARFGDDLVDHRTWVMAGDGCLMEGISHESISLAGRYNLNKLTVLWDDNQVSIDGPLSISETGDQAARFKAAGWAVRSIDGHDPDQIRRALAWARRQDRPGLIACRTRIGRGAATLEGHPDTHGKALGSVEIAASRLGMGWTHEPFTLPDDVTNAWAAAGKRGAKPRGAWTERLAASPLAAEFERAVVRGDLPAEAFAALDAHIARVAESRPTDATRAHSGAALEALIPAIPELVGGSADLTGSNNTRTTGMVAFDAPDYAGRYVHWGVREHGMAAAMNGMALHGGAIPYGGTFLVFSDYSRPAIRMAALQGARVVHVMTHDSIGLGEDGPTHQPIEHLASLRAMPNLYVFRPADAVETAECWKLALELKTAPSILSLSRQKVPAARSGPAVENLSARGAYELAPAEGGPASATLFASGTEVSIALAARAALQAQGVPTRVVSTPCWALFDAQDAAYQASVIAPDTVRVAVEAAVAFGWERFVGEGGGFVGMRGFGASAPYERLYREFGIDAQHVVAEVRARLIA